MKVLKIEHWRQKSKFVEHNVMETSHIEGRLSRHQRLGDLGKFRKRIRGKDD